MSGVARPQAANEVETGTGEHAMGLFDFVGNIGKKLFGPKETKEDAAAKIKAEIDSGNLGITDLQVGFQDGTCSLAGDCPSAAAMQKAVLLAGNVQGVTAVDIANLRVPPPTPIEEKIEYYIIQSGDTLSKIAKHYYGDANKYPAIFEANREVIKNADLIFPGQKIRIPAMV
jgi:nucleoid-associated protein YgaU